MELLEKANAHDSSALKDNRDIARLNGAIAYNLGVSSERSKSKPVNYETQF